MTGEAPNPAEFHIADPGSSMVVRVLPDVSGMEKTFDYMVPAGLQQAKIPVRVGTMVRVELQGRRVGGWIVETDVAPPPGVTLKSVAKVSSIGPAPEVVALAREVASQWGGRWASVLKSANPDKNVTQGSIQRRNRPGSSHIVDPTGLAARALDGPGIRSVRVPPTADVLPFVLTAAQSGSVLVITPEIRTAQHLYGRIGRAGVAAHILPRDWASAASSLNAAVLGARSAVLGPVCEPAAIIVVDEHDEALKNERNPNWHARDVAIERARAAGIPCVLLSPSPSLDALNQSDEVLTVDRTTERTGWPLVQVVDRRREEPGRSGLFSPSLVRLLRREGQMLCILNRKGRAVMLACASCGELIRTTNGEHLMVEDGDDLVHHATAERRPKICAVCNGTKLKRLRLGVNRAREELEALMAEPVGELTAESSDFGATHRIMVGTEALLHRVESAAGIAFLDFDAELLASRYRAAEQSMALIVRAARLLGGRMLADGVTVNPARLVIQTRNPEHRVLAAVVRADPGRFAAAEAELRRTINMPPYAGLAQVTGAGAPAMIESLGNRLDLEIMGPDKAGAYLIRGESRSLVASAIAEVPRTADRVRTIIDPLRA